MKALQHVSGRLIGKKKIKFLYIKGKMFEFKITFAEFVQASSEQTSGNIPESEFIIEKLNETANFK